MWKYPTYANLPRRPLLDQGFNLPKYVKHHVEPALASLETIFLDCNLRHSTVYTNVDGGSPKECASFFLRSFLGDLPQLQYLRLNFARDQNWQGESLLKWLSKPASPTLGVIDHQSELPQSPPPVNFLYLQQLDIGMVSVTTSSLIAVLQKFAPSLHTISFHKISLLGNVSTGEVKVSFWDQFFDQLSKVNNLNLTSISLSHIYHYRGEHHHDVPTITFRNSKYPMAKKWSGPDMQSGLRDFKAEIVVTWPAERKTPKGKINLQTISIYIQHLKAYMA